VRLLRKTVLANTQKPSSISAPAQGDAVFYPGGHGPLWDLVQDSDLDCFDRYASGKPVAAVCLPRYISPQLKAPDGSFSTKTNALGFANTEEAAVD